MLRVILKFNLELSHILKRGSSLERVIRTETSVVQSLSPVKMPQNGQEAPPRLERTGEPGSSSSPITDHGTLLERAMRLPVVAEISRMKEWQHDESETRGRAMVEQIEKELATLR